MVDAPLVTRLILDFRWNHPCVVQTASSVAFFNRIAPMWNYLPSNVRHITNYSSFISSLKRFMFEKMHTGFVSSDCCSWFFKCLCCNCCFIIIVY